MREGILRDMEAQVKKAGGPYRFSTVLAKRTRQLVKGSLRAFGSEPLDPINRALEEFAQSKLQILEEGTLPELPEKKEKK